VLTTKFLVNVEAEFNENCDDVTFKDIKWKYPLEALKAVQVENTKKVKDHIRLDVHFDLVEANRVMAQHGAKKKLKKEMYTIKFVDLHTLRDFVFHLKRLYHLHRLSKVARDTGREGPKLDVGVMAK